MGELISFGRRPGVNSTGLEVDCGIVPEMSFDEIALELGVSRSAVVRLYWQALGKLWYQFRCEGLIAGMIPPGWKKQVFIYGRRADRF